jgi:hypothetical protein
VQISSDRSSSPEVTPAPARPNRSQRVDALRYPGKIGSQTQAVAKSRPDTIRSSISPPPSDIAYTGLDDDYDHFESDAARDEEDELPGDRREISEDALGQHSSQIEKTVTDEHLDVPENQHVRIQYTAQVPQTKGLRLGTLSRFRKIKDLTEDEFDDYTTDTYANFLRNHPDLSATKQLRLQTLECTVTWSRLRKDLQPNLTLSCENDYITLRDILLEQVDLSASSMVVILNGIFYLKERPGKALAEVTAPTATQVPTQVVNMAPAAASVANKASSSRRRTKGGFTGETATTKQMALLPEILASCVDKGNWAPAIGYRWKCRAKFCKHNQFCCYILPEHSHAADNANHHMYVDGDSMIAWSNDIETGRSTVEEPAGIIISMLTRKKEIKKGNRKKTPSPKQDTKSSDSQLMRDALTASVTMTSNLIAVMTAGIGMQMGVHTAGQPAIGMPPSAFTASAAVPPPPSSPLRSNEFLDQDQLIRDFFAWYVERHNPKEATRLQLNHVRDNMINEDWDISNIRVPGQQAGQGGSMTPEAWKALGGASGTLVKVQAAYKVWSHGIKAQFVETQDDE